MCIREVHVGHRFGVSLGSQYLPARGCVLYMGRSRQQTDKTFTILCNRVQYVTVPGSSYCGTNSPRLALMWIIFPRSCYQPTNRVPRLKKNCHYKSLDRYRFQMPLLWHLSEQTRGSNGHATQRKLHRYTSLDGDLTTYYTFNPRLSHPVSALYR